MADRPLFELHAYVSPLEDPLTFLRAMAVPWIVTAAPLAAIWHAAPAAYLPVASFMSVSVPLVVTNMVLTEIVFNVPGVLRYFEKAIEGPVPPGPDPDYASLQVFAVYAAVFIVLGTIVADLVAARLDPRVRTGERRPG